MDMEGTEKIRFTLPLGFHFTRDRKELVRKDFYSLSIVQYKNPMARQLLSLEQIKSTQKATSIHFDEDDHGTVIIIVTDTDEHRAIAAYLLGGVTFEHIMKQLASKN